MNITRSEAKAEKKFFAFLNRMGNSRSGPCLYPVDPRCLERSCKAHSIQNRSVLDSLAEAGHVIAVNLHPAQGIGPDVEFRRVGRRSATTFVGLCARHDTVLFAPIDRRPLDFGDREQMFLLGYRSLLREAHASARVAREIERIVRKQRELGVPAIDPSIVAHLKGNASWIAEEKSLFDEAYLSGEYGAVEHEVAWTPSSSSSLAVSSFFSIGRNPYNGEELTLSLNVFPHDGRHAIVLSFRRPARQAAQDLLWGLKTTIGDERFRAVSRLVLKNSENFVIRPNLYDSFGKGQKRVIGDYFRDTLLVPPFAATETKPVLGLAAADVEKLNLFAAVGA